MKNLFKFAYHSFFVSVVGELKSIVVQLDKRVLELEGTQPQVAICPAKPSAKKPAPEAQEEDDVDLFGSDSEASGKLKCSCN